MCRPVQPPVMPGPEDTERHERRRLRPSRGKDGFDALLDDLLFGGGEVTFLAMPTLTWLVIYTRFRPVKAAAAFTFFTMAFYVGILRGGWVDVGAPWPGLTVRRALFRVPLYGAVLFLGGFAGALVEHLQGKGPLAAVAAILVPVVLLSVYPHYARWRAD